MKCCQIAGCLPTRDSKSSVSNPAVRPLKTLPGGGRYDSAEAAAGRPSASSAPSRTGSRRRGITPTVSAPTAVIASRQVPTRTSGRRRARSALPRVDEQRKGGDRQDDEDDDVDGQGDREP